MAPLTTREIEILRLVVSGATNAQIARSLGVGTRAVARHLTEVFRKLRAVNRAQAVAVFLSEQRVSASSTHEHLAPEADI